MDKKELLRIIDEAAREGARALELIDKGIPELPPEIGQLTKLQRLVLGYNQLSSLPPEFGKLTNLRVLLLYGNQLSSLRPEFGRLTNLQSLHLDYRGCLISGRVS